MESKVVESNIEAQVEVKKNSPCNNQQFYELLKRVSSVKADSDVEFVEKNLLIAIEAHSHQMLAPLLWELGLFHFSHSNGGLYSVTQHWKDSDWARVVKANFSTWEEFRKCKILYNCFSKSKHVNTQALLRLANIPESKTIKISWNRMNDEEVIDTIKKEKYVVVSCTHSFHHFYFRLAKPELKKKIIEALEFNRVQEGLTKSSYRMSDEEIIDSIKKNEITNLTDCYKKSPSVYYLLRGQNQQKEKIKQMNMRYVSFDYLYFSMTFVLREIYFFFFLQYSYLQNILLRHKE
ncbi:MAG: hypothetical protein HOP07_10060 [Bacteriovoracaceae bacterium]|nr:hypothetical protein [Bacteriovoracaceae bacterium]